MPPEHGRVVCCRHVRKERKKMQQKQWYHGFFPHQRVCPVVKIEKRVPSTLRLRTVPLREVGSWIPGAGGRLCRPYRPSSPVALRSCWNYEAALVTASCPPRARR